MVLTTKLGKPFYRTSPQEIVDYFLGLDRKTQIKLVVGVVSILLFMNWVVWPAWFTRSATLQQVQTLKSQIQLGHAQIQREPALIEEGKKYESFAAQAQKKLFEGKESLLGILDKISEKSKVVLISSQPEYDMDRFPELFKKKYSSISYVIHIEGSYHNIGHFVSAVESYPKTLRVDNLSIEPHENTPTVHQSEMRVSAFWVQGKGK